MISRLGLGLLLLTMAACSSAGIDRSGFTTNVCTQGRWSELSGVTLADPTMYLAHVVDQGAGAVALPQITSSVGTPCVAAADLSACKAAIAAAKPLGQAWHSEQCGGVGCTTTRTFFVAEKAGVVTVIESFDALRAVIAPTDGAAEAVLLAAHLVPQQADSRGVDCTQPQAKAVANGGWEIFLASGDGGCTDRVERRLLVAKDGTTTVIEATTKKASESCNYP